jgi:hypothetical protein
MTGKSKRRIGEQRNCYQNIMKILLNNIVSVENLHIHGVLTSTVVDTDSDEMMEMN